MWRRLRERKIPPAQAYDLWSASYDSQTDNVVMFLEQQVFEELVQDVALRDRVVLDVGCGTGRHWARLLADQPAQLIGYDASAGMLAKLRERYPNAVAHRTEDHKLRDTRDHSCDVVVSSLTLGYLPNAAATIAEWRRVLKPRGEIIVTDFHPAAAAKADRSFRHGAETITIRHHVHPLDVVRSAAVRSGLEPVRLREAVVDDSVRRFYEAHGSLAVFEATRGDPLVYGLRLKLRSDQAS